MVLVVAGRADDYRPAVVQALRILATGIWNLIKRRRQEAVIHQLSEALDQSPYPVVITGVDVRIQYVNRAFTDVSGYRQPVTIEPAIAEGAMPANNRPATASSFAMTAGSCSSGAVMTASSRAKSIGEGSRSCGRAVMKFATIARASAPLACICPTTCATSTASPSATRRMPAGIRGSSGPQAGQPQRAWTASTRAEAPVRERVIIAG